MQYQGTLKNQTNVEKQNKDGGFTLPYVKCTSGSQSPKDTLQHKDVHIDQWSRMEICTGIPHLHSRMVSSKSAKVIRCRKDNLFHSWRKTRYSYANKQTTGSSVCENTEKSEPRCIPGGDGKQWRWGGVS